MKTPRNDAESMKWTRNAVVGALSRRRGAILFLVDDVVMEVELAIAEARAAGKFINLRMLVSWTIADIVRGEVRWYAKHVSADPWDVDAPYTDVEDLRARLGERWVPRVDAVGADALHLKRCFGALPARDQAILRDGHDTATEGERASRLRRSLRSKVAA